MDKYEGTSLQEKRGRSQTLNRLQGEDTSKDSLLNRNGSRSPYSFPEDISYFHQNDTSLNRSRNRTIYSYQAVSPLNRSRSRTPYLHREDSSLNKSRSRTPYPHQEDSSLNKSRSRIPYPHQEDSSLNKSRSRIPYLHREDSPSNMREKERNISEENSGRNRSREREREVAELRLAVSDLIKEVKELRHEKETLMNNSQENQRRAQYSVSPDPSPIRYTKARKTLEPMNREYRKAFRDEVFQILKGLNNSLFIDHTKRWLDIERDVSKNTLPAIKKALGDRFQYSDTELKKVLQTLHRHQRDAHSVSMDPLKSKTNKQRIGTNSRRKDKKERRQRGLRNMIDTKDELLIDLRPSSMEWNDWINSLDEVIDNSNYHSDEVSETDEEKVQEEEDNKIRPLRKEGSSHVLHVYDKTWRSQRVRLLLRRADEVGETIQNIKLTRKRWYNDQVYMENNSKPPRDAPEWTVSTSYNSE